MSSKERILHLLESSLNDAYNDEDESNKCDTIRSFSFNGLNVDLPISQEVLVSAGFYVSKLRRGLLICAWCKQNLPINFRPVQLYSAHQASCPKAQCTRDILMQTDHPTLLDNMPDIDDSELTDSLEGTSNGSQDHSSQTEGAAHNARVLSGTGGSGAGAGGGEAWRALGVVGGGARHPARASVAARRATFRTWPLDRAQSPAALADAGFFYTGVDDQVRCFYCDGGLGKWEAADQPWREHARWFPTCGYVLLIKGAAYVEDAQRDARHADANHRVAETQWSNDSSQRRYAAIFPLPDQLVEESMESHVVSAALSAGLDVARVRRAIIRRLRSTGLPFANSESVIDAVLNEQLDEDWETTATRAGDYVRDLFERPLNSLANPDAENSSTSSSPSPRPSEEPEPPNSEEIEPKPDSCTSNKVETGLKEAPEKSEMSLEEENRLLKEARLCKVCMDNEVSAVFLPCGHLAACGACGAALAACPLCRAPVRALVRAYLA